MDKKIYTVSNYAWFFPILLSIGTTYITIFFILALVRIPTIFVTNGPLTAFITILSLASITASLIYVTFIMLDVPGVHLQFSEDGVIFSGSGFSIYTPWENIVSLGWFRFAPTVPNLLVLQEPSVIGLSLEEGISSRRAVTVKRRWWLSRQSLLREAQYTHAIYIPVLLLRREDKQAMQQDLYQYLPQLMEQMQTQRRGGRGKSRK